MEAGRAGGAAGEAFLLVGRVRKPHGVRGELFVWVETDRPEAVFRPGRTLWMGEEERGPGDVTVTVERSRPFKDGVLVKLVGHTSRTEALEEMRGRALFVRRADAPPLEEDEVYYHELMGLRVIAGGVEVGTIRDVYETPGADLLVVRREGGKELLIPFAREIVVRIAVAEGVLEIDPPAGLLDL